MATNPTRLCGLWVKVVKASSQGGEAAAVLAGGFRFWVEKSEMTITETQPAKTRKAWSCSVDDQEISASEWQTDADKRKF